MEDYKRQNKRPRRRASDKKQISPVILIVFCLAAAIAAYFGVKYYMPNFKTVSFYDYNSERSPSNIQLALNDTMLTPANHPVIRDGEVYLSVDFIKDYVDKYIYWDDSAKKLTITTEYRVIQMNTEDLTYYVNMDPMTLNLPVYAIDDMAYMPKIFLEEHYGITIHYNEQYNIAYVDYTVNDKHLAQINVKKAAFRYEPDKKSPIIEKLLMDTEVTTYEEVDEYTKIRTEKGLIGYVLTKQLGNYSVLPGYVEDEAPVAGVNPEPIEGKINLVWDQIINVEQNWSEDARTSHEGLDVLSPTWFKLDRETYNGDIITIADLGYVNWAHQNGYRVWALMSDEEDGEVTAQILSDQHKREHVIKQILAYVSMYDLDGINIDFERVREADVAYFHQFLRELWPLLKEQGIVLSVDTFVPRAWSMYYNRAEIANTVDYICVMTYDEHTYGDSSGPNASIGFVEEGIASTLKEVPAEKLIMGVPFYSRVWIEQETASGIDYKIRSLGMNYANRLFTENGVTFQWLEDLGCYYGEYNIVEAGVPLTYKTWLEDERSMAMKLELVDKYNLAGVSAWVRGLEKEEIWPLFKEYLK